MKPASSLRSTTVRGCLAVLFVCVIGCASPKAVVEPPVETVMLPAADPAPSGPPPGHVEPTNYVVRERIVLTSEPAPPESAPQKSVGKKVKKSKKTGKG
jgi:hypothetical protein